MSEKFYTVHIKDGRVISATPDHTTEVEHKLYFKTRRKHAAKKAFRRSLRLSLQLAAIIFGFIVLVFLLATVFNKPEAAVAMEPDIKLAANPAILDGFVADGLGKQMQDRALMLLESLPSEDSEEELLPSAEVEEPYAVGGAVILPVPDVPGTDFKTFMDYRCITAPSSRQYKLQQYASTGDYGIRYYFDLPMIAVGTYYTDQVSTIVRVYLDNGEYFDAMVGDIKSDIHTTESNQVMPNGNCVEFIVDTDAIPAMCLAMGDMSYAAEQFAGCVTGIEILQEPFI